MALFTRIFIKSFFFLLLASIPNLTQAGGLYLYELGNPEIGLAGAGWAARAQDAATAFTNPAGMTRLDHSELMVGIQPLYLNIDYKQDGNTTISGSDGDASTWLPAAGTYYVHNLAPNIKLGMAALGYFGLGLDYDDDWVGRYYVDETKLQTVALAPSLAYRVNERFSVGMGVNVLYSIFEKKAAINNLSQGLPDGKLKMKDEDWTVQLNLGILFEPRKGTRFGIRYLSEADLEFEDRPDFSGLGPGLSTILENRGLLTAQLDLEMTMPQAVMFSAYHDINETLAIMGNLGWQNWSEFGMVGVSLSSDTLTGLTVDRNYDDTWHAAIGFQYRLATPWLLSAGLAYDSAMVDEKDLTPDLVAGEQWRFGIGCQYAYSENLTIGFGYTLAWTGDLDMDINRGPLAGEVSGTYEKTALHFTNLNLIWKF